MATDPHPRSHTRRGWLARFAAINLLAALLLWALEWWVADRNPIVLLLGGAPQAVFALPPLITLLLAIPRRDRAAAGWSGAALAVCLVALMGLRVPLARPAAASGDAPTLRVMTYNVEKWSHGTAAVAREIAALEPDVVCLQEAGRYHWLTDPQQDPDTLPRALPGYRFRREGEVMVGSRLPVRAFRVHPLPPGPAERPALEAVVTWQGKPLRVVGVHLIPLQFGEIADGVRRGSLTHVRTVTRERLAQTDALLRAIGGATGAGTTPLLLCGDFNAQPQSLVCRRLTARFPDAFERAGWGYGYTLTAKAPVMRVDHILLGGPFDVRRCWVPNVRASDHRPVVADVSVQP